MANPGQLSPIRCFDGRGEDGSEVPGTRARRHGAGYRRRHNWTRVGSLAGSDRRILGSMRVEGQRASGRLRLAEMIAALSLTTDLGMGFPLEHSSRACLLATHLGRRLGLSEADVADVYYTALLKHIGCTAFARDQASYVGGDDNASLGQAATVDFDDPRQAIAATMALGRGHPPLRRARLVATAMARGKRWGRDFANAYCEVGTQLARRMGFGAPVVRGLGEFLEQWNGKGDPRGLAGEDIALTARIARAADQAVVFSRLGGIDVVREAILARSGGMLDPNVVAVFLEDAEGALTEASPADPVVAVVETEPEPWRWVGDERLDEVARAFCDAADMKSPYHRGHSREVARIATAAAAALGLPEDEVRSLARAALLHDLGRVAVATGIWEKPGPLSAAEWEKVRLHAYHTERVLARSSVLAPLAQVAGMHHERQDGSGYHREAVGAAIPIAARLLAAADTYQAMTQERAHRSARPPEEAAEELRREGERGVLEPDAVRAVLAASDGVVERIPRERPAGLTEREVEVLRLITYGLTTRQVARRLVISPRTADHHIEHIYAKLGVSSRAAAALFAIEHELVAP